MPNLSSQQTFEREARRSSLDSLIAHNFLYEAFTTTYDGYKHTIQSGQERVFPRYLAMKYFREIVDHRINMDEKEAVAKEVELRKSRGHPPMTPQEKDQFVIARGLRTNNPELRKKYMKLTYKGVSEKYGMDITPEVKQTVDSRPMDIKLLDELDKEMGTKLPEAKEDIESKKEELERELL